jgi:hypothetical protein
MMPVLKDLKLVGALWQKCNQEVWNQQALLRKSCPVTLKLNGMEIAVLGLATHLDEPPELAMFAKVLAASATAKTFTISMYCIETHPCQHVVTFADEDGGQRKERLNGREIVALYQIWGKAPVSHFDVYRLAPK